MSVAIASALAMILTASAVAETPPQPPSGSYTIKGTGATFPAPIYNYWEGKFKNAYPSANVNLQYSAIGTGGGKTAIKNGTTDYGAGDAYMTDTDLAAVHDGLSILHVPMIIGSVSLGIHLSCTTATITLTGANVGDLFSGAIKKWNDAKLRTNGRNAALKNCNTKVTPVHRADSSGTTFIFTSYLWAETSSYWANKLQSNPAPHGAQQITWPVGIGQPRNSGVATRVKNTNGAIGYMELSYAHQAKLKVAKVQNGDHSNYVSPTAASVTAAATAGTVAPSDLRIDPVIGAPGSNSYPIVGYTFLFIYKNCTDATCGSHPGSKNATKMLISYVYWALTSGQQYASSLYYAKLPTAIKNASINQLKQITWNGSQVWTP